MDLFTSLCNLFHSGQPPFGLAAKLQQHQETTDLKEIQILSHRQKLFFVDGIYIRSPRWGLGIP